MSHPFQNDSLLCIDTITALGLQYVFVRKAGRFIGELASVMIAFRERNRQLSHGQLSWSFVDELGFELAPRHLWLLTFLKSPKCVFSDGSAYNSWNAAAGVTVAGCHELPTITPSDMSLNHIGSESIDLISFDDELPASTPIAVGGVSDVFVNNFSLNPCGDLLDDRSVSRIEGLLCEIYRSTGRIDKLTKEISNQIKSMNTGTAGTENWVQRLDKTFDQLDQKLDQKFDNFGKKFDIKFHERFNNFERKLDAKFHEQLEQFENSFTSMDTVIANKLESAIDKAVQRGFDQLRKTVDLGLAHVNGEVMQVGEKLTGFQSAMTDELANFRSTVIQEIDKN